MIISRLKAGMGEAVQRLAERSEGARRPWPQSIGLIDDPDSQSEEAEAYMEAHRSRGHPGGAYSLGWNAQDIVRIQELTERCRDLDLGLADAAVIACAERHEGRVLTTDFRHFPVVARGEQSLTILP